MMRCSVCDELKENCTVLENRLSNHKELVCKECEPYWYYNQDLYWDNYFYGDDEDSY